MSKPLKKTAKRLLIALLIVALLGGCFGAVALYAKKEINKPKFKMPESDPLPSATALPTEKTALVDYVNRLYAEAVVSDEAEGAWRTDVDLGGDMSLPFAADDLAIASLIRDGAAGEFSALYPAAAGVKMSEATDAPALTLQADAVTAFTARQGREDDAGETLDEDLYFVDLTLDPTALDAAAYTAGPVFDGAMEKLAAAVASADAHAEIESYEMHFRIDRVGNRLLSAEIRTALTLSGDAVLTEAYAPLTETGAAAFSLPYKTTAHVDFNWYGARFTERAIAARPGDMTALPADVRVNGEAVAGEDFTLSFTASDPDAITIDADGVMTVHKAPEETAEITMTLEYGAHTYTDVLTVYITELEVESDV